MYTGIHGRCEGPFRRVYRSNFPKWIKVRNSLISTLIKALFSKSESNAFYNIDKLRIQNYNFHKYNFFRHSFDSDVSSARIQAKNDSFMTGERNAVEMVQYNMSGDDLYVTFEQTGDELGSFAKFKLLFYNGDQIVDTEDGYLISMLRT